MKKGIKSEARLKALKEMKSKMKKVMTDGFADKLPMKVTVASDSPEGLKEGLSKAEQIMKMRMGSSGEGDKAVKEAKKTQEESREGSDLDDLSPREMVEKDEKKKK